MVQRRVSTRGARGWPLLPTVGWDEICGAGESREGVGPMSWGLGFWAGRWSVGAFGDVPGCRCVPKEAPPRGQQGGEWDRGHGASSSRIPPAVRDLSDATGHPEPPPHPHRQPRSAPKSPQRLFFHSISLRTTAANRLTVGQAAAFQQPPHFPAPSSLAPGACVCGGVPSCLSFPPSPLTFLSLAGLAAG